MIEETRQRKKAYNTHTHTHTHTQRKRERERERKTVERRNNVELGTRNKFGDCVDAARGPQEEIKTCAIRQDPWPVLARFISRGLRCFRMKQRLGARDSSAVAGERVGGRASQRRNDKGNEQGINRLNVHAGGEKEQPTGLQARQRPGEETCKRAYGERGRERERERERNGLL